MNLCHSYHSYRVGIPVSIPMWQATPHFLGWRTPFPSTMRTEGVRSGRCRLCNCFGEKRVSGLTLGSWDRPLKRNCLNNSPAFQRVTQGSWTLWMQENPVCKELSSQPSASLCKRPAEQAIRTYIRVFQNFWKNGNQRFLGTTFAPGRRETLRFAKKLRFLLSPGL